MNSSLGRAAAGRQRLGEPVDGAGEDSGGSSPGPRLRANSAKVSAVVYFGWNPSVSRICVVSTTLPCVSSRICSGEKSEMPMDRSAVPTQVTVGSRSGTVGRPSRREVCDSSRTPSPAILKVPLLSVPRRGAAAAIRSTSMASPSWTNCSRGS